MYGPAVTLKLPPFACLQKAAWVQGLAPAVNDEQKR